MNSTKVSKRILALDILRGVTIAGMIMPPCDMQSGTA